MFILFADYLINIDNVLTFKKETIFQNNREVTEGGKEINFIKGFKIVCILVMKQEDNYLEMEEFFDIFEEEAEMNCEDRWEEIQDLLTAGQKRVNSLE